MTPRRNPGTQLPLLIKPDDSTPEIDTEERRALLESMLEGWKTWEGPTGQAAPTGGDELQNLRDLVDESIAAFAALGLRVRVDESSLTQQFYRLRDPRQLPDR